MRLKSIYIGLIILFFANPMSVFAQKNNEIKNQFESYINSTIFEKIYLQTDKEYYQAGEIIWMNAYTLNYQNNQFLDFSKVLYVDIIDNQNQQILSAKTTVDSAKSNGSLFIPLSTPSGKYKIRAYTSWMKNFSPSGYFEKYITIINPQKINEKESKTNATKKDSILIHFFPESGKLVSNIKTKIAYLVETNANIDLDNFSVFIIKDKTDTVQKINLNNSSLGHFYFTAESNASYSVAYSKNQHIHIDGNFPEIYTEGYSLHISEDQDKINVQAFGSKNESLQLFIHNKGNIQFFEKINVENGVAKLEFNKEKLSSGISYFTLFNGNGAPLAERLYFKAPSDSVILNVQLQKNQFKKREEVALTLQSNEPDTHITLSVYQLDALQKLPQTTIQKYIYFLSELKTALPSSIRLPHFSENESIDDILLTFGWRKFDWNAISKTPQYSYTPEIYGHLISGMVSKKNHSKNTDKVKLKIGAPSLSSAFNNIETDLNKPFYLPFKNLYGSSYLVISTDDSTQQYDIKINNPFSNQFTKFENKKFKFPNTDSSNLLQQFINMQVQNIFSTESIHQFQSLKYMDTSSFYFIPTSSYLLDQYTRFTTIEEVLREYVPNVDVRRDGGKLIAKIFDSELKQHLKGEILFLLDGVAIDQVKAFFNYDPLKLKQLDVIPSYYLLGKSVYSGIVSWKSYQPDIKNYQDLINNSTVIDYEGLQLARTFYSPVYPSKELKESNLPDFRNVLYWQSATKTNDNNQYHTNFYTSDLKGKFAIIAEGISNGKCGSAIKIIEVE